MSNVCQQAEWGTFRLHGWTARWLGWCQKIRNRRMAVWMRKPLKAKLSGWVDVEVWGLRLRLAARGNLSEQRLLFTPSSLDPVEREALEREVGEEEVFLDIGANAGAYTFWMGSRRNRATRIEAFEPDPELCRRLDANLERNGLTNVTLHRFALGEEDGTAFLKRNETNLGENEVVNARAEDTVEVRVRRLDDLLREKGIARVAALKIDVEGREAGVLRPYFATVPREDWPRLVVCEIPPKLDDVSRLEVGLLLQDSGYRLVKRGRMNGVFRRDA